MWNFILYVLAVVVGLVLIYIYEPSDEKEKDPAAYQETPTTNARKPQRSRSTFSSFYAVLGFTMDQAPENFQAFTENFTSFEQVGLACKKAGLEACRLIIGVDFTASNEWQGRKSFNRNCLHKTVGSKIYNPYQKVIWILGQTLEPFNENREIHAFGFGDSHTTDEEVFPFLDNEDPCQSFNHVLDRYTDVVKGITLAGPTSFAPLICKAIQIVRHTHQYHILVIIADGQVNEEGPTIDAIVEASKYPISIIVVGVGDGPWDVMQEFDHRLPKRKFDNFHFIDYHKATFKSKNPDEAFALQALMEIPDQYKEISKLGYLSVDSPKSSPTKRSAASSPTASPKRLLDNAPRHRSFCGYSHTSTVV